MGNRSTPHIPWREQLIANVDDTQIGFIEIIAPHEEESHYWARVRRTFEQSISGLVNQGLLAKVMVRK